MPAKAIAELRGKTPAGMIDVLNKSLAGDRNQRFSVAGDMARQLDLCRYPETVELLSSVQNNSWAWVRRFPIATLIPMGLLPNLVASILNIRYNQAAVIDARPEAQATFHMLITWINPIFFTIGLGTIAWLFRPVDWVSRRIQRCESVSSTDMKKARQRCTHLGTIAALVGVICWCVAGVFWPLSLDYLFGWLSMEAHIHFLASLTLCGLIAAVYPFFIVTWFGLSVILPALLAAEAPEPGEIADLKRVDRALGPYLLIAAAVPLVGIAALVFIDSQDRTTMKALVAIGLAGCAFAFLLERKIRATIRALTPLYR